MKKTKKQSRREPVKVTFIDDSASSRGQIVATRGSSTRVVDVAYFTESKANKILDAVDRVVMSH